MNANKLSFGDVPLGIELTLQDKIANTIVNRCQCEGNKLVRNSHMGCRSRIDLQSSPQKQLQKFTKAIRIFVAARTGISS